MATPPTGPATGLRAALGLIFLAIAALIMILIYVSFPANDHVTALLGMGVVALVFALIAYFASSLSPTSLTGNLSWWGLAGLGFALIVLTLGFAPDADIGGFGNRILGFILTLLALAAVVASAYWMRVSKAGVAKESQARAEWAAKPPANALDYPQAAPPSGSAPKEGPRA
jgi:hypothetical protein